MGGGAWPFLVGGVICLVNSVNERDLGLLIRHGPRREGRPRFLEGHWVFSPGKFKAITGL